MEAQETGNWMEQWFGLPGFVYGVDGMLIYIDLKSQGLLRGPGLANQNSFHMCKGCYGINAILLPTSGS